MLFQKLGYTDVKTKIMFIENKIALYQIIGIDRLTLVAHICTKHRRWYILKIIILKTRHR